MKTFVMIKQAIPEKWDIREHTQKQKLEMGEEYHIDKNMRWELFPNSSPEK
jgi:hypothetical protein